MAIKALVFDFDGLIVDTEWPEYITWVELFKEYQSFLPIEEYARCLGTSNQAFNPVTYLSEQIGQPLDEKQLRRIHRTRADEMMKTLPVLPGVEDYLHTARRYGMKLAVASSSSRDWVTKKLEGKGLLAMFDQVFTREDVAHVKPDPALYTLAVERLGVQSDEAIALEDSPNGILAAKAAGLFCIAIPSRVSRQLDINHADLVIDSLAALPLDELLARFNGHASAAQ